LAGGVVARGETGDEALQGVGGVGIVGVGGWTLVLREGVDEVEGGVEAGRGVVGCEEGEEGEDRVAACRLLQGCRHDEPGGGCG